MKIVYLNNLNYLFNEKIAILINFVNMNKGD